MNNRYLSPAVRMFAEMMQDRLDQNVDKGNIMNTLPQDAVAAAHKNITEMYAAMSGGSQDAREAAVDVANYLMAIVIQKHTKDVLRLDQAIATAEKQPGMMKNNNPHLLKARDDEPLFILRAQDVLAPALVDAYAAVAEIVGVPAAKIRRCREISLAMKTWDGPKKIAD